VQVRVHTPDFAQYAPTTLLEHEVFELHGVPIPEPSVVEVELTHPTAVIVEIPNSAHTHLVIVVIPFAFM
jgi:hypothetical protein